MVDPTRWLQTLGRRLYEAEERAAWILDRAHRVRLRLVTPAEAMQKGVRIRAAGVDVEVQALADLAVDLSETVEELKRIVADMKEKNL